MSHADDLQALNRSEHLYWACEGYLGSIHQPYVLRFQGPLEAATVRQALRELTSACPRLRGVVEPTRFSHALRILPDDAHIDALLDDAFQVQGDVDPTSRTALQAWHTRLLNDPMPMERGLPWRARLLPHPTQPVLAFSAHHIIGDGRSMVQFIAALVARLNGQPIAAMPLQSASMAPAVRPKAWWHWPGSIARFLKQARADARERAGTRVLTLARRASPRFTTSTVHHHALSVPADALKALVKAQGTTVNTLLLALVAEVFLEDAAGDPKARAAIRLSIDLRRHFPAGQAPEIGNHVHSFVVHGRPQPDLTAQIADLDTQVRQQLARYERRDHALPLTVYEWLPLMGRRLYSHLIVQAKRRQRFAPVSCHLTNLGPAEFINPKDATLRVTEFWPATVSTALLIGALSLQGRQLLTVIHQNDEVDPADVRRFLGRLDEKLQQTIPERAAA